MVPSRSTRREALYLSSVALAGLAGCTTRGSDGRGTPSPTVTVRQYAHSLDAPETRKVRNPEGEPAVRSSVHTPERDPTFSGGTESPPGWDHEYWFVAAPDERDALEFTEATEGVEAAKEFVAGTDLTEATLLVQQYRAEACTTVRLRRLEWEAADRGPDGAFDVHADYEDAERDGDCEHGTEHGSEDTTRREVRAILSRLPVDVETVRSFSYGW